MKRPTISVIIPIYNVESYLVQCVDSVRNQTYKEIEIILVNDGSPDNSPAICDEYAQKDNRVKVIHKENGGLSDARNEGLKKATGDFVVFLDSDDYWLDQDFLESIFTDRTLYLSDLILFKHVPFIEGDIIHRRSDCSLSKINVMNKTEALNYLIYNDLFSISAWSKIVRRSILLDNDIIFEKGRLSEDLDWSFRLLLAVRSIKGYDKRVYAYRIRKGSITHTFSSKHMDDLLTVVERWTNLLEAENVIGKEYTAPLLAYCKYQYSILVGKYYDIKAKEREPFKMRLNNLKRLMMYRGGKKTGFVSHMYNMCFHNIFLVALGLNIYIRIHERLKGRFV